MIPIREVTCVGSEANVFTCTYVNNTVPRSHQQDVGVQCEQGEYIYALLYSLLTSSFCSTFC